MKSRKAESKNIEISYFLLENRIEMISIDGL